MTEKNKYCCKVYLLECKDGLTTRRLMGEETTHAWNTEGARKNIFYRERLPRGRQQGAWDGDYYEYLIHVTKANPNIKPIKPKTRRKREIENG
jgi:hypothetical protein